MEAAAWSRSRLRVGAASLRSDDTERGSISVIAVGMIAGVLAVTGSIAGISAAFVAKQRVAGAADASALAAADVASGAVSGYPCERAAEAATINGAVLIDCALDGSVASVGVSAKFLAFEIHARARAGPPESPSRVQSKTASR